MSRPAPRWLRDERAGRAQDRRDARHNRRVLDEHYAQHPQARPSPAEILTAVAMQARASSPDLEAAAALMRAHEGAEP